MKIGITGASGFLGFHTLAFLKSRYPAWDVKLADHEVFIHPNLLESFVCDLSVIIHYAGVNRSNDIDIEMSNIQIANNLTDALIRTKSTPCLIYSNSTHHTLDTHYGRGKRSASLLFEEWAKSNSGSLYNVVIPNVFGEFGKPFYNSVVSTFCFQLASGDKPSIHFDGQLELIHAQDVASYIIDIINAHNFSRPIISTIRLRGLKLSVSELLVRLTDLFDRYRQNVIPNVTQTIDLQLFNTLRSYIFTNLPNHSIQQHNDIRGVLFEAIKSDQGGQTFISRTKTGITRGNHYHLRKIERFLVINGEAEIRLRRLYSHGVTSLKVTGNIPTYVDIPTFYTHSITNTGSSELLTLFWANELYNPDNADTYHEVV